MRLFQAGAAPWGPDDTTHTPKNWPKSVTKRICSTSFFLFHQQDQAMEILQVTSLSQWIANRKFPWFRVGGFGCLFSQGYVGVILAARWFILPRRTKFYMGWTEQKLCIVFGGWQLKDGPVCSFLNNYFQEMPGFRIHDFMIVFNGIDGSCRDWSGKTLRHVSVYQLWKVVLEL